MSKQKQHRYRLRFYLNASHAMRWDNNIGEAHPHTWELICEVKKLDDQAFIRFNDIEDAIQRVIEPLQGRFLNEIPPFDKKNPSLENIGDVFFDQIDSQLASVKCSLTQLEVGESPTRFFLVREK
ncbi:MULTISPECIES: 6-carboxytetrahydropterin synthase [Lactobacillaceae]|uniref:6-carboxy-5,6,7,8-tetrahydropterin synthase n=1 Tax=Limosilactobacillus alvi TaxID=990412 RepID=A0ABS2EL85_9LACO|nr:MULTISPECIES: 6-carboxytetrahydropterin synthase [Lactobacillaceae]MBM6753160.1 6-carboxytetrahydropterin synthase [Limosilactobacillus alvi]QLL70797.1 6-pyruvoyl tetrahydropterin synthase [Lactobacillus sp. 3B(2020)]